MKRVLVTVLGVTALLAGAVAQAATISTNLSVTATISIGTSISATGTATLTNIGSGTFAATVPLSGITGTSVTAPYTITLSGGGGTITGNLTFPSSLLTGSATSGSGSGTVTGGTGPYAGAVGSFPTLTGSATGSIVTSISLTFSGAGTVTTGGTAPPPGTASPTITDVLDAGSYTKAIAQGSIFVVKGSTLSASGFNQFGFPLPATSGGVKITFTPAAGGAGTDAYLVYTYNQGGVNQLAGILPSTVAAGSYNVTVTNNGSTSAGFAVQVVQRKIGLITQDSSGSGLVVAQNYISASQLDVDRFTTGTIGGTTISPSKPGQVLIAWATGMGPVSGGDNIASPGFNFAANGVNVQVIVGGMSITPDYAGRAPGLAGADQINFTLPANVPTGCTVSFQVSVNGALSNPTFIAIAPNASATACVLPGYTSSQLQNFDNGGKFTVGSFGLSQLQQTVPTFGTVKFNTATGAFVQVTGFQLAAAGASQTTGVINPPGTCQVLRATTSSGSTATGATAAILDAGAITLNGPPGSSISNLAFKQDPSNAYSLTLASEGLPSIPGVTAGVGTIVAGTYTLSGAGGKDVGKFNASVNVGAPLTITGGLPSTVTRSSGLTLNWTGGLSSDLVEIFGSSSSTTGTGNSAVTDTVSFFCLTTAGPGTFTVPASILTQLPAVAVSSSGLGGFLEVVSTINPTSGNGLFTAPLTAGGSIDSGLFIPLVGIGATVAYQ